MADPALLRDAQSDCTKERPVSPSTAGRQKSCSITYAVPAWRTSSDHEEPLLATRTSSAFAKRWCRFHWRLTPFKTNISDVEYQVTEKGRAASVDNA